ncbi:MAG TPA: cytochrome b/b6 domain-containing protein [Thermohalobaculum sp.]|nr:cytochrome b/b6 domain-containing protein [Thermohalobaculum sp.]
MPRDRYGALQRLIHWTVALLVLGLLAIGFTLATLGFEGARDTFGIDVTNLLYKYHKTFGVIVLGLMTLRLLLRLAKPPPPYHPPIPSFYRTAGRINHWALYALLLAQPVVGWAATAAGGFPIEFFDARLPPILSKDEALSETLYGVHGVLGVAILALAALHASAAIMHWLVRRDGVMHRMTFG